MEYEGYLIVRVYLPRKNITWVDIIKDYNLKTIFNEFNPIDVSQFIKDID